MCMTCSCGQFSENHGNPSNLTINDIEQAARAANISLDQCCDNLARSCQEVREYGPSGQQRAA